MPRALRAGLMAVTATGLTKTGLAPLPHLRPGISHSPPTKNLQQLFFLLTTTEATIRILSDASLNQSGGVGLRGGGWEIIGARRIDGSHELLAGEESNIGAAGIEDLQQE